MFWRHVILGRVRRPHCISYLKLEKYSIFQSISFFREMLCDLYCDARKGGFIVDFMHVEPEWMWLIITLEYMVADWYPVLSFCVTLQWILTSQFHPWHWQATAILDQNQLLLLTASVCKEILMQVECLSVILLAHSLLLLTLQVSHLHNLQNLQSFY